MKVLLTILLLVAAGQAQNFTSSSLPDAPSHKHFWDFETKLNTGILAGLIAADAVTTQSGLSRGYRETNPLMRPFVNNGAAGEAAGSAVGFGAGLGVVYLLHHTNHHKAERIAMRLIVAGEGAVVAHNVAVLR